MLIDGLIAYFEAYRKKEEYTQTLAELYTYLDPRDIFLSEGVEAALRQMILGGSVSETVFALIVREAETDLLAEEDAFSYFKEAIVNVLSEEDSE